MATAERLALRVGAHGGAALVIDYGRGSPPYTDSLIAIRQHKGVHALSRPGTADLSAWVDFGALRLAAEGSGAAVSSAGRPRGVAAVLGRNPLSAWGRAVCLGLGPSRKVCAGGMRAGVCARGAALCEPPAQLIAGFLGLPVH
jgi:hypothetical protein